MKKRPNSLRRLFSGVCAPVSLVGLLVLVVPPAAGLRAADAAPTPARSDNKPALPVTTTLVKSTTGENQGLFELKVTNTSPRVLTVSATVLESVQSHNRPKTRELGPQVIEPGKDWTIDGLAAMDRVTLKADGFEPLEITVH